MGKVSDYLKSIGVTKNSADYNKQRHKARMLLIEGFSENERQRKRTSYVRNKEKLRSYRRDYRKRNYERELQRDRERWTRLSDEARSKKNRRAKELYAAKRHEKRQIRNKWYSANKLAEREKIKERRDKRNPTRKLVRAQRKLRAGIIDLPAFVNEIEQSLIQINEGISKK